MQTDTPLSVDSIHSSLGDASQVFRVEVLDTCDSTNSRLMAEASTRDAHGRVLVCETQTAGRGRRDRAWYSSTGGSLTFSLAWRFPSDTLLSGLGLAVGVAVAESLEGLGVEGVKLKWPNDILADGGKLGGILIEAQSRPGQGTTAVIGIGLNHTLPEDLSLNADLRPVDLRSIRERPPTRNDLLAGILRGLARGLPVFAEHGFAAFRDRFQSRAAYLGEWVVVRNEGSEQETGRYFGVDADGAMLLSGSGGVSRILIGDVSLRPAS